MGPRVFTRGNFVGSHRRRHGVIASMGPRVFTRGNVSRVGNLYLGLSRFNGATRLHAWKPHTSLQRLSKRSRFNGATRLHAWKPGAATIAAKKVALASMGPRVFTRGNIQTLTLN